MKTGSTNLKPIPHGKIPKVLLLGNGINRAFGQKSWEDFLDSIALPEMSEEDRRVMKKIPYPLQVVALSRDGVDEKLKGISEEIYNPVVSEEQRELLLATVGHSFDTILTTNYTYEIEKAVNPEFFCKPNARSKYRNATKYYHATGTDRRMGLFRYMDASTSDRSCQVWHIHGEAAISESMVLGHYYYGRLLSRVQLYTLTFQRRYRACSRSGHAFDPCSWVDYFLLGDIYILGQGLDFSEMDLWWLINCKKRLGLKGQVYFIEPNMEQKKRQAKKMLLETYGVKIVTADVQKDGYKDYFWEMSKKLGELMQE